MEREHKKRSEVDEQRIEPGHLNQGGFLGKRKWKNPKV
jgi:hypothetical protein